MEGVVANYLAGRGLGEGEVDLGLDGETNVVGVDGGFRGVVCVELGVGEHLHHVAVP